MGYAVTDSADIRSKGLARINKCSLSGIESSSRTLPSSEIPEQGKQAPLLHGNPQIKIFYYICHRLEFQKVSGGLFSYIFQYFAGIPDFSEVYSFIGSVFDPDSKGHAQKLREMDPINFETVS